MSKIIRKSQRITEIDYDLGFAYAAVPGAGFGFPCSPEGEVFTLSKSAQANLAACLTGEVAGEVVIPLGVREFHRTYTVPALLRCDCGARVQLDSTWANACSGCGREYNGSGQLLAPRWQWGEETGEWFGNPPVEDF
jgi:hypothetical protein